MPLHLSLKGSTEHLDCDLTVEDSIFRLVSVELQPDGELWVWLPLSLGSLSDLGSIYRVTLGTFGMAGLN